MRLHVGFLGEPTAALVTAVAILDVIRLVGTLMHLAQQKYRYKNRTDGSQPGLWIRIDSFGIQIQIRIQAKTELSKIIFLLK
jgi:hypothetical protein